VFRNNKVSGMDMDTDTPSLATRTEQGRADRAIFVSDLPPAAKQEELLESMEPFGKYEQFVTRMLFALLSLFLKQVGSLSAIIIIDPGSKHAYFERGPCRANTKYSPTGSCHHPGADPPHRACRESSIQLVLWFFGGCPRAWETD
jgi:hypothetical protein